MNSSDARLLRAIEPSVSSKHSFVGEMPQMSQVSSTSVGKVEFDRLSADRLMLTSGVSPADVQSAR